MDVLPSTGHPDPHEVSQEEVRQFTTHLIFLMKEDGVKVEKNLLQHLLQERITLERNFKMLGKLIGAREVRFKNGAKRTEFMTINLTDVCVCQCV